MHNEMKMYSEMKKVSGMRKVLLLTAAFVLVLCLSGCVNVSVQQTICADGTVDTVYDGAYQDGYFDYQGTTPEAYFGLPSDEIPTVVIDGETYYKEHFSTSITLDQFRKNTEQPAFAGLDSFVNYTFYEEDGTEYCTIRIEANGDGQSAEDLALQLEAIDDPVYNYEGLEKICLQNTFVFENGLSCYECAPADAAAITADEKSITVNTMKLTFSSPVIITGIVGSAAAEDGQPFSDVREGSYYADAVKWALENNVTKGTSATTFSPDAECTRAQVVTFLWNAAGQPEPVSTENPFTDVRPADWYYKAVLWAVENKITSGTSSATFSPLQLCQNSHIVTFLWNANGKQGQTQSPATWYSDAYAWAAGAGLLEEIPGVDIPADNCPRSNIVLLMMKQYGK